MKRLTQILVAATLIACLGSPASAQAPRPGPMGTMPSPSDSASTKEFKQAQMKMMQNMQPDYTGNADIDFRTGMIPHHQGAIDMAKVALKYAKDPDTKTLAQNIIKAQEKEIADMQAWLKKNKAR